MPPEKSSIYQRIGIQTLRHAHRQRRLRHKPFAALLAGGSSRPNKQPGNMRSHARRCTSQLALCCVAHPYLEQFTQQHAFTKIYPTQTVKRIGR